MKLRDDLFDLAISATVARNRSPGWRVIRAALSWCAWVASLVLAALAPFFVVLAWYIGGIAGLEVAEVGTWHRIGALGLGAGMGWLGAKSFKLGRWAAETFGDVPRGWVAIATWRIGGERALPWALGPDYSPKTWPVVAEWMRLRDSLGRRPTDDEFHEHMRELGWSRRIVDDDEDGDR